MRLSISPERHRSGPFWKEGGREVSLQRLKTELDLTNEQTKEIETVLEDFMMYYQTLQAQMDDVYATGKGRIMRILRDDQKQKFEKMMGEIQKKRLQ